MQVTSFFGKGTVGFFRAADKALVGSNALQPVEQLDFQDADDEMTTGEVCIRHSCAMFARIWAWLLDALYCTVLCCFLFNRRWYF